jgi:hypothetical protein
MMINLFPTSSIWKLLIQRTVQERFDNCILIEQTKCPVCIFCGTSDTITPKTMAETLFALARLQAKRLTQLVLLSEKGHNLPDNLDLIAIIPSFLQFLQRCILFPGIPDSQLSQHHLVDFQSNYWNTARKEFLAITTTNYKQTLSKLFASIHSIENTLFSFSHQNWPLIQKSLTDPELTKELGKDCLLFLDEEANLWFWVCGFRILFVIVIFVIFLVSVFIFSFWIHCRKYRCR